MILKRIAAICFALSFIMAIALFTDLGSGIISRITARSFFLIFGAAALILNLLSFRYGKHPAGFNFLYWLGSIVVFIGLTFILFHWPYGYYIILAGMGTVGLSFFYRPNLDDVQENDDLLDDFDKIE